MPPRVVFEAAKQPPPVIVDEFALLENAHVDDELVYDISSPPAATPALALHAASPDKSASADQSDVHPSGIYPSGDLHPSGDSGLLSQPFRASAHAGPKQAPKIAKRKPKRSAKKHVSRPCTGQTRSDGYTLRSLPSGKQSLLFEGLAYHTYAQFLFDTGASHSYVSLAFCKQNNIVFDKYTAAATLANGSEAPIVGQVLSLWLKLGPFRAKHSFLVVDMPQFDVILGMDFMAAFDAVLRPRKRTVTLSYKGTAITLHAFTESALPDFKSDRIELCTLESFSHTIKHLPDDEISEAFVAYLKPELNAVEASADPLYSGKGASDPEIQRILKQFDDVLVSKLPGGLPPEHFAADGSRIEHTVETSPDEKPYSRPPLPFTPAEHEEIKRYLADFIEKG